MKKILFLPAIFVFSTLLFSQTVDFSGDLNTIWAITVPGTKNAGAFSTGTTDFTGTIKAYAGSSSACFDGTITYDATNKTLNFYSNEAYIDYTSSFWGLRLGRQKVVWGKADVINITNTVFPKDDSSLFTYNSSLPVTAAKFSLTGNSFSIDALWIPLFTGTKLPLEDNNYFKSSIFPSSVTYADYGEIQINTGTFAAPEAELKNSEYGLKISGYLPFCDFSIYGFYGWEKTPLISLEFTPVLKDEKWTVPDGITFNGKYERLAMLGADAAFPIGSVVLRLEGAYFPNRTFQKAYKKILHETNTGIKQHQLMGLAGIDFISDWTVTAQYYLDVILNKDESLQRTQAFTHGITYSISKGFFQETLKLSLMGIIGFNDFDSVINFNADYSLTDQIKFSAGTYLFFPGPKNDGNYGQFKDFSSVFLKCSYSF